jgi:hypothetical protein
MGGRAATKVAFKRKEKLTYSFGEMMPLELWQKFYGPHVIMVEA